MINVHIIPKTACLRRLQESTLIMFIGILLDIVACFSNDCIQPKVITCMMFQNT